MMMSSSLVGLGADTMELLTLFAEKGDTLFSRSVSENKRKTVKKTPTSSKKKKSDSKQQSKYDTLLKLVLKYSF